MRVPVSDEDAIRQVLRDGTGGDFCDVADAVKKKFGLTVGSALVEKVYQDWRKADVSSTDGARQEGDAVTIGHVDLSLMNHIDRSSSAQAGARAESTVSEPGADVTDREYVLEFVQKMGGFAAARDAIRQLEQSLQGLLKT